MKGIALNLENENVRSKYYHSPGRKLFFSSGLYLYIYYEMLPEADEFARMAW